MAEMSLQQINKEIARLNEVGQALIAQARKTDGITALEEAQPKIEFGSKGHEAMLASGYGFDAEEARKIIKERDADPVRWPLEEYRKAKAFLAALTVKKPATTSTKPPWRIRHHGRKVRAIGG